jgi:FKBP-type peptidyl-prolyl cis-trans isomerase 2
MYTTTGKTKHSSAKFRNFLMVLLAGSAAFLVEGNCLAAGKITPQVVEAGDIVLVDYAARTASGGLVQTTWPEVFSAAGQQGSGLTLPQLVKGPREILAGEPGGELPGIGETVIGARVGEKTAREVPAEKAFGPVDPTKMVKLPRAKRMPAILRMQPTQYVQALNAFPVLGNEVQLVPYFKARVIEVTEMHATLKFLVEDAQVNDHFGTTEIKIEGEDILLRMNPIVGSVFEVQQKTGIITQFDDESFTVDFNHPMAGKPVNFDLQVVSLTKKAELDAVQIPWVNDHDQALKAAESEKKNMMLVLYAGWCSWSKKLLTESLEDPRIKQMKERFVWVKVDSDKEQAFKEAYQQNGFPMVVVLNSKGDVVKKIDGYRDAAALRKELEGVL